MTTSKRKQMTREELKDALYKHRAWILENPDGVRLDLSDMDVSGSDFIRKDLSYSILRNTIFHGSNFSGASLLGADCSGSDMSECRFWYTDLRESILDEVDFSNCDFKKVEY